MVDAVEEIIEQRLADIEEELKAYDAIGCDPGGSANGYAKEIGVAAATAGKHLAQLVEVGQVLRIGERCNTSYRLA